MKQIRPIFKIGDKVVGKRDNKIQKIYRILWSQIGKGRFIYNDEYWSEELRYATDEEVAIYFQ